MATPPDYVRTIVEAFIERRGKGTAVSSADMHLVGAWENAGISVDAALRGIDTAFSRRRQPPASLVACNRHVQQTVTRDNAAFGEARGERFHHGPEDDTDDADATNPAPLEDTVIARIHALAIDNARPRPVRRAAARLEAEVREIIDEEGRLSAATAAVLDDALLALVLEESTLNVQRKAASDFARTVVEEAYGPLPAIVPLP